jgi:predicted outer membrane protein
MRNRTGRLMATWLAGTFALGGAVGCAEPDEKTGAGHEGPGHGGATASDGTDSGRTGGGANGTGATRPGTGGAGDHGAGGGARRTGGGQSGGGQSGGGQGFDTSVQCGGQQGSLQGTSDGEIARLVSTINERMIELSDRARNQAESREVQRYADQVVRDHMRSQQRAEALFRSAGVKLEHGRLSERFDAGTEQLRDSMQGQEGAHFDRAYVQAQIALHRRALQAMDTELITSTKNEQLRSQLQELRTTEEQHLMTAERIFCSLPQGQQQGPRQQQGRQQDQQQGRQQESQRGQQQQQGPRQQQGRQQDQQQGRQQEGQQQQGPRQQQGQQQDQQRGQQQQQGPRQEQGQQQDQQRGQQQQQGPRQQEQEGRQQDQQQQRQEQQPGKRQP